MPSPQFSVGPNEAYTELGAHPPGQGWFAFDTLLGDAKKGRAAMFAMTVWNLRDPQRTDVPQPIRQDVATGSYWYKVPRSRDGEDPKKRTSLWNGVRIAQEHQLSMSAILKDRDTRRCSLDHVFDIVDVRYEVDGSAFWLKLKTKNGDIGTEVEKDSLGHLLDLPESLTGATTQQDAQRRLLTHKEYEAICDAAAQVHQGLVTRQEGIARLEAEIGIKRGTAGTLFNNYRCMASGTKISSPMSADGMAQFADSVIAVDGAEALPRIVAAIEGFIEYAKIKWGNEARDMRALVEQLQSEWTTFQSGRAIAEAVMKVVTDAQDDTSKQASEILREVWVRGPQHAAFRRALMRRWRKTCSVHGASCNGHLRASHIDAWSLDEKLRGDPDNGLLLSVPLDSLFDRGLVSFDDAGDLLRSHLLSEDTATHFGVCPELRLSWAHLGEGQRERIRANLARHRSLHAEQHGY